MGNKLQNSNNHVKELNRVFKLNMTYFDHLILLKLNFLVFFKTGTNDEKYLPYSFITLLKNYLINT